MIPFILIGVGLFIIGGVIHFTIWWWKRLKTKENTINRDIKKFSLKNDWPPNPPTE